MGLIEIEGYNVIVYFLVSVVVVNYYEFSDLDIFSFISKMVKMSK